jgi:hypothetical protein
MAIYFKHKIETDREHKDATALATVHARSINTDREPMNVLQAESATAQ